MSSSDSDNAQVVKAENAEVEDNTKAEEEEEEEEEEGEGPQCPWTALTGCSKSFVGPNKRALLHKHAAAGICWEGTQHSNVLDRTCPVCGLSLRGTAAIKAHNKMYHPKLEEKVKRVLFIETKLLTLFQQKHSEDLAAQRVAQGNPKLVCSSL